MHLSYQTLSHIIDLLFALGFSSGLASVTLSPDLYPPLISAGASIFGVLLLWRLNQIHKLVNSKFTDLQQQLATTLNTLAIRDLELSEARSEARVAAVVSKAEIDLALATQPPPTLKETP